MLQKWLESTKQKVILGQEKNANIKEMGDYICPGENDTSIFAGKELDRGSKSFELSNGSLLLVDPGMLRGNFVELMSKTYLSEKHEYGYKIFKTEVAGISDYTIIGNFNIIDPMPLPEILCVANHMIKADMENAGPLFVVSKDNDQENINLGYYTGEFGKLKMVFLERKRPEAGKPREYHLHETDVPRDFYKINRYFIIPQ